MRANLREYIRFGLSHPDDIVSSSCCATRAAKPTPSFSKEHNPVGEALFNVLKSRIEQGVASGKLRCLKTGRSAAQSVWAAMHGLVALRLAFPDFDWVPVDEQIEGHVDMLLYGIIGRADRQPNSAGEAATPAATPLH